ncbi:glycoside hydrolase family 9 protein, partial [candidate division KSB1 bacterium]|nr:glycoside hydrolase family 9 protein [candidate division KSB1 bacterium]
MIPISKYTKFIAPFLLLIIACSGTDPKSGDTWIRINQLGYFPQSVKIAVLGSKDSIGCTEFSLSDAATGKPVWTSETIRSAGAWGPFKSTYRLDFSSFQQPGCYTLKAATAQSPPFRIAADVYDGTADFLLRYMRQQRCGFNPFLRDSCHTHDGYTIYGPMPDGTHIDVTGGWHDAGDYLQYAATSANATFHLLFAWREFPTAFTDSFDASGLPGSNGLPDVLDEA